jgi:hypothetical protein
MGKTTKKAKNRDEVAAIVAEIHGVSPRYVNMVRNGERENEEILASLVEYKQSKSKLIQHLRKLVPIKPNPKKYAR